MSEDNKCPICGEEAYIGTVENHIGWKTINCKKCGEIIFTDNAYRNFETKNNLKFKSCMHFYLTHLKKINVRYLIVDDDLIDETEYKDKSIINVNEILNLYPDNISERIDLILLNLSKELDFVGDIFTVPEENERNILFLIKENEKGNEEKKHIIKMLINLDFIEQEKPTAHGQSYSITFKGWDRIDKISKKYKSNKKAFIAMSFDNKLKSIRGKIKEAIIEMGYIHSIIDEKDHNEFIVSEIMYEIETSDFVVADLTGNRGGVYFEAGYARALGKEVILTVDDRKDKKGENIVKPHFDVAQINQVRYKDEEDLKKGLMKRIEATVGKAN
jgi:nucleoside 2-deoxyribosyltransferase